MDTTRTELLVLGLDGAARSVLEAGIRLGVLPRLAEVAGGGFLAGLRSVRPPVTGPAWASFLTGANPGRHGIYSFTRSPRGAYHRQVVHRGHVGGTSLLGALGAGGRRVAAVNVPLTWPPEPVNGIVVTGMLTPSHRRGFTHPPELAADLVGRFGDCDMDVEWQRFGRRRAGPFLRELERTTRLTGEIALEVLRRGPWDLFLTVFTGPDRLQHLLWDVQERALGGGDDDECRAVLRYLRVLDGRIGRLMDAAAPAAGTVLLSDHGFGPLRKLVHLNEWLRREGLLQRRRPALAARMRRLARRAAGRRRGGDLAEIDWGGTRAYFASHTEQGLHVNLRGREAAGIVEAGEYEILRTDLIRRLRDIRDPETGSALVSGVWRREEVYRGPCLEEAPDLLFELSDYSYLAELGFSRKIFVDAAAAGRGSGTHRMDGILAAVGPAFSGAGPRQASIPDVAPTVLHLLGLRSPAEMDGRILREILAGSPSRLDAPGGSAGAETTFTREEEARLRDRLRGLGYVE